MAPPHIGELILGCHHRGSACGNVASIIRHVTVKGLDHFIVLESWNDRRVRVKRAPNGGLYEIELVFED